MKSVCLTTLKRIFCCFLPLFFLIAPLAGYAQDPIQHNFDFNCECSTHAVGIRLRFKPTETVTETYCNLNGSTGGWPQNQTTPEIDPVNEPTWSFFNFMPQLRRELSSADVIHVGLSFVGTKEYISLNGEWLDASGTPFALTENCYPHLLRYTLHDGSAPRVNYINIDTATWTINKAQAEYYSTNQPLNTLNAQSKRNPIRIDTLGLPSTFTVGQTASVTLNPPAGAKFVVLATYGSSNPGGAVRMWSEYPLANSSKTKPWIYLIMAAILVSVLMVTLIIRRMRLQK